MTVDLTPQECAELILTLRHTVDAAFSYQGTDFSQSLSMSVIGKLCKVVNMPNETPWDASAYDELMELAES